MHVPPEMQPYVHTHMHTTYRETHKMGERKGKELRVYLGRSACLPCPSTPQLKQSVNSYGGRESDTVGFDSECKAWAENTS